MTEEQKNIFENELIKRGYKKITNCKAEQNDDFEYYKTFYYPEQDKDDERHLKYQTFFQFWNFGKYEHYRTDNPWSISVCVMPESCENNVGRRDLQLSTDWVEYDIDRVEKMAEEFYDFVTKFDKKNNNT